MTVTVKTTFPVHETRKYLRWMALFISSEMMSVFLSPSSSLPQFEGRNQEPGKTWQFSKELSKKRRVVIERLAFDSQLTALSHRVWRTKLAGQMEECEAWSKMEKDFSQCG